MIVLQLEYLIAVITFVTLLGSGDMREENMQTTLCVRVLKKVAVKEAAVILLLRTWFASSINCHSTSEFRQEIDFGDQKWRTEGCLLLCWEDTKSFTYEQLILHGSKRLEFIYI